MGFQSLSVALFVTVTLFSFSLAYTWPNPHLDELESQRYDRLGFNARDLGSGVTPCDLFFFSDTEPNSSGRLDAADWIRTVSMVARSCRPIQYMKLILQAYHDMATHDISDGTGGMDASIRLELDRPEVCLP